MPLVILGTIKAGYKSEYEKKLVQTLLNRESGEMPELSPQL
jgi:hypothetical protein